MGISNYRVTMYSNYLKKKNSITLDLAEKKNIFFLRLQYFYDAWASEKSISIGSRPYRKKFVSSYNTSRHRVFS